jgi:hypothetical protein
MDIIITKKMKTKLPIENDGFQSEFHTNNTVLNDKMVPVNGSLTESSISDTITDFLLPESLGTDAPNKISVTERKEISTRSLLPHVLPSSVPALIPSQEDGINAVVDVPVFNLVDMTTIMVDIQLVEPHPLVLKVSKEKNLNGLKLTMRLKGLLEPIKVVQRNEKLQIVDGISRYWTRRNKYPVCAGTN